MTVPAQELRVTFQVAAHRTYRRTWLNITAVAPVAVDLRISATDPLER